MLAFVICISSCTNLFVYFVAISILLRAIADKRTSTFCCIYRWTVYELYV